jgi:DNA-binding CsgD family transcriptional regulator
MTDRRSNVIKVKQDGADVGGNGSGTDLPGRRSLNCAPKITAAENRVLTLVSGAKTNKEIAAVLGISPATVKRHLESILKKLQLRNRVEAAIYGLTINGCPRHSESDCTLKLWQKEKNECRLIENGPSDP